MLKYLYKEKRFFINKSYSNFYSRENDKFIDRWYSPYFSRSYYFEYFQDYGDIIL